MRMLFLEQETSLWKIIKLIPSKDTSVAFSHRNCAADKIGQMLIWHIWKQSSVTVLVCYMLHLHVPYEQQPSLMILGKWSSPAVELQSILLFISPWCQCLLLPENIRMSFGDVQSLPSPQRASTPLLIKSVQLPRWLYDFVHRAAQVASLASDSHEQENGGVEAGANTKWDAKTSFTGLQIWDGLGGFFLFVCRQ